MPLLAEHPERNVIRLELRRNVILQSLDESLLAELEPGLPAIEGDLTQLRQVIHNLVQNALDAVEQRPDGLVQVITETARADTGELRAVRLRVSDNGGGFGDKVLKRFDLVLANPPFSLSPWGHEEWKKGDKFGRDELLSRVMEAFETADVTAFCTGERPVSPLGPDSYSRVRDLLNREASRQ